MQFLCLVITQLIVSIFWSWGFFRVPNSATFYSQLVIWQKGSSVTQFTRFLIEHTVCKRVL